MYHIFLIHSLVKGHLGCFQVLAMTNKAAMNIVEHTSLTEEWIRKMWYIYTMEYYTAEKKITIA